ncbi:MAG: hypothetical protein QOF84_5312 [Streptomyces sp.]|jgi:uncharacterized membrane protein YgcG|nr:hypothetical protein [Streptomyces sp.]
MKTEGYLFAGVALFFGVNAVGYGWFSREPAGTAALTVATLMASVVAFFCLTHYRRRGLRPQDRAEAEVADNAGPLEFFPPHSPWPVVTAAAITAMALGVVYGLWLFIIAFGLLAPAVFGFVFQYARRDPQRSSSEGSDGSTGTAGSGGSGGSGGISTRSP